MREVEVSGFVQATPTIVADRLSPTKIIEYEGSFRVEDVTERDGEWLVTVGSRGLEFDVRFRRRENGYVYEQGENGPLETMETTLTVEPENEGSRIRFHSTVSMGYRPKMITDRFAAWKRRGELKRALKNVTADLE